MTDYAELWLQAQRAHKDIFEAALRKDWIAALSAAESMRGFGTLMADWFEDKHLEDAGK